MTTHYDFDQPIERRGAESCKWTEYGNDVLPLWVADMDFAAPEPVLEALRQRVSHGVFGYDQPPPALREAICERLQRLYGWSVTPEQIIFLPGLVVGLNLACRTVAEPGGAILAQTPVYPPFLTAPGYHGLALQTAELAYTTAGQVLRYEIDFDRFEAAISNDTRLFILCNPHNPVGRCYTRPELTRLAEICIRHDVIICSDEIHCDLLLTDAVHLPLAALSPEIADRCITLMAPSKTFNIAGLECGFAIVPNPKLRRRLIKAARGIVSGVNLMGATAALAAYKKGQPWLAQVLPYLTANRDFLVDYIRTYWPEVRFTIPEATYLAWLDCREAGIEGNPYQFFLKKARVALNDGSTFGPGGGGFVRLNFGCTRATLTQALAQMRAALAG